MWNPTSMHVYTLALSSFRRRVCSPSATVPFLSLLRGRRTVCHVVTVTAHVQTSSQDCTFCSELWLSRSAASDNNLHLFCLCRTFVLSVFLICVRCPCSLLTLCHLNHFHLTVFIIFIIIYYFVLLLTIIIIGSLGSISSRSLNPPLAMANC